MLAVEDARLERARVALEDPALRAELAEWHVLSAYDLARCLRYGDMAASRRGGELDRRASKLIAAGVPVLGDGSFPVEFLAADEVRDAFERVGWPRFNRANGEAYRRDTKYTQATLAAWHVIARRFGVELAGGAS